MGAHRVYYAVFQLGAKLQGSFNAAMAAAKGRMASLQAQAKAFGTQFRAGMASASAGFSRFQSGVTAAIGAVKKLIFTVGALGTVFGAFAIGKIWHEITEGATEAAKEEAQTHRNLAGFLMANNSVRAKGVVYAEKQAKAIEEANEAYSQQVLYGHQILNTMSAQVAVTGMPGPEISRTTKAMADVLAAKKGVYATKEDAQKLGYAWSIAVKSGMARGIKQFNIILSKDEQTAFGKMTQIQRQAFLIEKAESKMFKGRAAALMKTPEGRIYLLDRAIHAMSRRIGHELLPAQAAMADAWRRVLPEAEPIIKGFFKMGIEGSIKFAHWVKDTLIPAWISFRNWLGGPVAAVFQKVKAQWDYMTFKVGKKFVEVLKQMFGSSKDLKGTLGDVFINALKKIGDMLEWIGKNADWLVPLVRDLIVAFIAWKVASFALSGGLGSIKANLTAIVAIGAAAAIEKTASEYRKFTELMAGKNVSDPEHFTKHWYLFGQTWTEFWAGLDAAINAIKEGWAWFWQLPLTLHEEMIKKFRNFDWTFGFAAQWKKAVQEFGEWWKYALDLWEHRPSWLGGKGGMGAVTPPGGAGGTHGAGSSWGPAGTTITAATSAASGGAWLPGVSPYGAGGGAGGG